MKYNGNNLILDRDIVVSSTGDTLDNKIKELDNLKSNVKFIYKHGALGGNGQSSGGGGSLSWKVFVYIKTDLGYELLTPNQRITLPNPGEYEFKLSIYGGNTNIFKVNFNYEGGKQTGDIIANIENNFTIYRTLKLQNNNNLNITIYNTNTNEWYHTVYDNQDIDMIHFSYITSAYFFDTPYLVRGYNHAYNDEASKYNMIDNVSIFMEEVKSEGLMLALKYSIATQLTASGCTIEYTDWLGNKTTYFFNDLNIKTDEENLGIVYFNLIPNEENQNIIDFLNNDDNADTVKAKLKINITLSGKSTPETPIEYTIKNSLIPSNLYLRVITKYGTLFKNHIEDQESLDEDDKFTVGEVFFYVTPYDGQYDQNKKYRLYSYIIDGEDEILYSEIEPTDQAERAISLPLTKEGENIIKFRLVTSIKVYEKYYYIYTKNISSSYTWYNPEFNIIHNASFKKSDESLIPGNHTYQPNRNITDKNGNELTSLSNIEMSINSKPTTYNFNIPISSYNLYDLFFALGIQYSSTNDIDMPICSINANLSTETSKNPYTIFIYQNKIGITNDVSNFINDKINVSDFIDSKELYIPMVDFISSSNLENYSLLTIYKNLVSNIGTNRFNSFVCSINGVFDSFLSKFNIPFQLYTSITFYPGNYIVNLIEMTYFHHIISDGIHVSSDTNGFMRQTDLEKYFYTYQEKMIYKSSESILDDDEKQLIEFFNEFEYDEDTKMVKCLDSSASNIAQHINIPVLYLHFTNNGSDGIGPEGIWVGNRDILLEWLNHQYQQEESSGVAPLVTAEWSNGKSQLSTVYLPDKNETAKFKLDIQGSSTKGYFCKNFELIAPDVAGEPNERYYFSPNIAQFGEDGFDKMLLPEKSFTLKADVVDSSHTNNNAIGDFVNDNLSDFNITNVIFTNDDINNIKTTYGEALFNGYRNKIKKCLTGFPILVFLSNTYNDANSGGELKTNYYYLGVYNFNLGRNSSFNLGYNYLAPMIHHIEPENDSDKRQGFVIYKLNVEEIKVIENLFVAEIQNNFKYFDFSQFDTSILYQNSINTTSYMWGDIIAGKSLEEQRKGLTKMVEYVAYTGGYIFKEIGKNFSNSIDDEYGYKYEYSAKSPVGEPLNQVPNYKWQAQATMNQEGSENTLSFIYNELVLPDSFNYDNVFNRLLSVKEEEDTVNVPILNYRNLCEYYTTCMAFGLVDSVQKNMNVKSWTTKSDNEPGTFYLAFYDMDTGLGIANDGTRIDYFAFSDYWYANESKDSSGTNILNEVTVYRDYAPAKSEEEKDNSTFFDIPSSYLFAIAKYAPCIKVVTNASAETKPWYNTLTYYPQELWALWRRGGSDGNGCLVNAKAFMDKYFNAHLNNIPICALNWNYRYKYFIKNNEKTGYDNVNSIKFYGNKRAYTENWLNGRFHLMDAYMNITKYNSTIYARNEIYELCPSSGANTLSNPDIMIAKELFSNNSTPVLSYEGAVASTSLTISADPYAPFMLNTSTMMKRYLFPNVTRPCKIPIEAGQSATIRILYGGSKYWKTLSSINSFILRTGNISISSKYLTEIIGTNRECNSFTFDTPALKVLRLTSPNYSGSLTFDNTDVNSNWNNLGEIDISNTAISLTCKKLNLLKLKANNMKSGAGLDCSEITTLEEGEISGKLSKIIVNSWSNDMVLPSSDELECPIISVNNKSYDNAKITIYNDEVLTDVNLVDFEEVTIENCLNLKKVIISESNINGRPLKRLTINIPKVYGKINPPIYIGSNDIDGYVETGIIDLSNYHELEYISINGADFTKLILPNSNDIKLGTLANNSNMEYINGTANLYITRDGTFQDCPKFKLSDENNNFLNIYVDPTCTSLANTFAIRSITNGYGEIPINHAKRFLSERCNAESVSQITNINSMFFNQISIVYDASDAYNEYKEQRCGLSLAQFVNCTNFSNIFFGTNVNFYNRYMFYDPITGNTLAESSPTFEFADIITNKLGYISTTYDLFYDLIEKITSLSLSIPLNIVYENNGMVDSLPIVKVADIFNPRDPESNNIKHPILLANINKFELYNQIIDLKDIFVKTINNIEYDMWTTASSEGINISNMLCGAYKVNNYQQLDNLFGHIKIKTIYNVLNNITSLNKNDDNSNIDSSDVKAVGVNMRNFIDWSKINENTTNLFYNDRYNSLGFDKYIWYNDFKTVMGYLLNIKPNNETYRDINRLTQISYIFNNCTILYNDDVSLDNEGRDFYLLPLADCKRQNTVLTNIDNLFTNLKIKFENKNSIEEPVALTWRTLYCLPKLKSVKSTFEGIKLRYPISFDFFHKRYLNSSRTVFINDALTESKRLYEYLYYHELTNMGRCFANVYYDNAQIFKENEYYNKDFEGNSVIKENYIEDGYNNYYIRVNINDEDVIIQQQLQQPSEIIDVKECTMWQQNNQTPYSTYTENYQRFTDNNIYLSNYPNYSQENGMFISPDIFYGCITETTLNITEVFSNNLENDYKIFTGTIPKHLTYSEGHNNNDISLRETINLSNIISGLNIKPILLFSNEEYGVTHNYYYFIPENFINQVIIDNVFNFKMLLPTCNTLVNEHFFLMLTNSISKDTIGIYGLPSPSAKQVGYTQEQGFYNDFYNNYNLSYPIYFNYIGTYYETEELDENDNLYIVKSIVEGFDLNYFQNLVVNGIFNETVLKVYYGNIFTAASAPNWSNGHNSKNAYIFNFSSNGGGLSKYAKIYLPTTNNYYIQVSQSGYNINRISILNDSDWPTFDNVNTYYPYLRIV